ncbi:MAG TPA: metallophosphoesterase [Kofleriaceae bacterium]|jgi:3',5'-cyclic AMP phosphodiesterase CpdA|nr:metallophosphoesterase [Kofleriaceae bacterium]
MESKDCAQLCWIFASEDEPLARELLARAAVLEAQGLIQSWTLSGTSLDLLRAMPEPTMRAEVVARIDALRRADIVVFLCSQVLLDGPAWKCAFDIAVQNPHTRVMPVIVNATTLPSELAAFQVVPRDGKPIMGSTDREKALLEVIQGLLETVKFRRAPDADHESARSLVVLGASQRPSINDIFRLDGPPSFTFIEPPQFARLKLELRTMGTGLIVEGPSKVGKSTAIRKAMESLGIASRDQIWWRGQSPLPLEEFSRKLDELLEATRDTWLFIDDFHHLEDDRYRRVLASMMKALADLPTRHAKVTLIGINPLGSSLVQVMPDLSGRFRILRLDIERDLQGSTNIAQLIARGEGAANIRFARRDEFVVAAGGSFFLAQYLCNVAAVKAGVLEAQPETVEIKLGPHDVTAAIQDELSARFRAPMIDFAAFDRIPPPDGATLSLLWLLARSSDGFVSVREARLRFPMLNAAFDWLLASNLSRCFQAHPRLTGLLYYNRATQTLTMEDPELRFYLRELNWEEFANASGHGHVRFHPEDGPLWPITGHANITLAKTTASAAGHVETSTPRRRILHLSDLHLATKDHATVSYSQLAADLREQQIEALDVLVVSGDLVNRADPEEYDAARVFLERLMSGFALSPRQVALVPGNHDVSWQLSEEAYQPHRRSRYAGKLVPGAYIEHDGGLIEVRNDDAYRKRFQPFAQLYREIKGIEYPLAYEDQGIIDDLPDLGLCILGLNSAWEIDHHFKERAAIHPEALANALDKLGAPLPGQLRIATFHHPLGGGESSRIHDTAFMQRLAIAGFRIALHGHIHKAAAELYRYERGEQGRRIEVVAAGTFGAHTREWVPGYPLEYNLLLVGDDKVTVETRCRREVTGAWGPDARWPPGPGQDPLPRYFIPR